MQLVLQMLINDCPKDDMRVFMGRFVDDCYSFVYFVQGQLEYDHGNWMGAHAGHQLRDPGWPK